MPIDRRTLLQLSSLLPFSAAAAGPASSDLAPSPLLEPSLNTLAGDPLTHHSYDLFIPPALQNEWGYALATKSICGITAITFPPFRCCSKAYIPWAPDEISTCELMLNSRLAAAAYPSPKIVFQWFPHCAVRQTVIDGIGINARAFLPVRRRAVAETITLRNLSKSRRNVAAGFILRAHVAAAVAGKSWPVTGDSEDRVTPIPDKGCVLFRAKDSHAFCVQGITPASKDIRDSRAPVVALQLGPGESVDLHFALVMGEDEDQTLAAYQELQHNFTEAWRETERDTAHRIHAAFTPGNDVYSGSLPSLHTRSRALWKLYHAGFTNLFSCRANSPATSIGPTYFTTLRASGNPAVVFLWDTMLTSFSLALLDPEVMRKLIEIWCAQDLTNTVGTDYVTGKGVRPGYSANDLSLLRCADSYLRLTGDLAWLDKRIEGRTALDHLKAHALRWKQLDRRGSGLSDYGTISNLLEVVSTYTHEVAATNAGNVYGMRLVAALLDRKGDSLEAREMRAEAAQLAERIIKLLYVTGRGYWRCAQPDGTYNEVRDAYDFLTVLDCMQPDLGPKITREMCDFFWRELYSPAWMRALSPADTDSSWHTRADMAWLGAYTAWPPMSAKVLLRVDDTTRVAAWIRGLARSANQGPFGQAHLVESAAPPENGGALKSPGDTPSHNDWCCVSGGSFIDLILEDIFGVRPGFEGEPEVRSRLAVFDPAAHVANFRCHGKLYRIDQRGARAESEIA